jgi:thioredoxin reductase (NADPH)
VERIEGIKNPMGIEKVHKVILKQVDTGRVYEEEVAAVFVFIGSDPNAGFIDIVEKDENGYIITDQRMQTNIPGIFSAGDVRNTPFRQLVVAAGAGAIAAHAASQYIDELLGQAY